MRGKAKNAPPAMGPSGRRGQEAVWVRVSGGGKKKNAKTPLFYCRSYGGRETILRMAKSGEKNEEPRRRSVSAPCFLNYFHISLR